MRARVEGTGTIWTNATGWSVARFYYFCGVLIAFASIVALEGGRCVHQQIVQMV
jgi:hypothetical protein